MRKAVAVSVALLVFVCLDGSLWGSGADTRRSDAVATVEPTRVVMPTPEAKEASQVRDLHPCQGLPDSQPVGSVRHADMLQVFDCATDSAMRNVRAPRSNDRGNNDSSPPVVFDLQGVIDTYLQGLAGQQIADWDGWVVATGPDVAEHIQSPDEKTHAGALLKDPDLVLLSADDPYAPGIILPPLSTPWPGERTSIAHFVRVLASHAPGQRLTPGQKVHVSGTIDHIERNQRDYTIDLVLRGATMSLVDDERARSAQQPELAESSVSMGRGMCFGSCPVYWVKMYGDGFVEWAGYEVVQVPGYRFGFVDESITSQILRDVTTPDFFSLHDFTQPTISDVPSLTIRATINGKAKRIVHDLGDQTAPTKLTHLEHDMDNLLNTRQWIGDRGW